MGDCVTDLLCFLFFTSNLGFFRMLFKRSTTVSSVPDLLCFLFFASNLGCSAVFGRASFIFSKFFDQSFCGHELE